MCALHNFSHSKLVLQNSTLTLKWSPTSKRCDFSHLIHRLLANIQLYKNKIKQNKNENPISSSVNVWIGLIKCKHKHKVFLHTKQHSVIHQSKNVLPSSDECQNDNHHKRCRCRSTFNNDDRNNLRWNFSILFHHRHHHLRRHQPLWYRRWRFILRNRRVSCA